MRFTMLIPKINYVVVFMKSFIRFATQHNDYNSSISHVSRLFLRAPDVELHCTDEHYSSSLSISKTSNCVYMLNTYLTPPINQLCTIEYFLKHTISFKNTTTVKSSQHISAYIQWFQILPEQHQKYVGETVDIWFLLVSHHCYIPVPLKR